MARSVAARRERTGLRCGQCNDRGRPTRGRVGDARGAL